MLLPVYDNWDNISILFRVDLRSSLIGLDFSALHLLHAAALVLGVIQEIAARLLADCYYGATVMCPVPLPVISPMRAASATPCAWSAASNAPALLDGRLISSPPEV
jgi:hypothetical protein